jgi:hypothetical protein
MDEAVLFQINACIADSACVSNELFFFDGINSRHKVDYW